MEKWDSFDIQIGSVFAIEPEIIQKASYLAERVDTNLGFRRKRGLAGPNDILYILGTLDLWRDLLPFVATGIASGTLGAMGKAIWDKAFKSKIERKLDGVADQQENLIARQNAVGFALQDLVEQISNTPRYWQPESEVRFCLPTATGDERHDVGFVIHDAVQDPAIAVMALNIMGPQIMEIVEEVRRDYKAKNFYDTPQVTGNVNVEAEGYIQANLSAGSRQITVRKRFEE